MHGTSGPKALTRTCVCRPFEEATIFNVQCNDTDVVVWTAAEHVQLSKLAVFNKSLTVYGYAVWTSELCDCCLLCRYSDHVT